MANQSTKVAHSLRSEELAAQETALKGRLIALAAVVPLVGFLAPWPAPLFNYALIAILAVSGVCAWRIQQSSWNRGIYQYAFVALDCVLVTLAVLYPNPYNPSDLPPQFFLRFGGFIYFFILLAELAYSYRPNLVIWAGFCIATSWSVGFLLLLGLPDTVWEPPASTVDSDILQLIGNPHFIDIGVRLQEVVMILVIAGLLALAVRRSRVIVLRQARLASERANLARYFPPKTAELLAERSNPFSEPREHKCAVMFADLVGFTAWSEQHSSSEVISLLRSVHGMIADVVFKHEGTLDKFMGDGVMATFGTPDPTGQDASNALAAMLEVSEAFARRKSNPADPLGQELGLAIGLHYGPVVIGDIGSEQRLEFAVLGDTVNVASRLEAATRTLGCRCLVSDDLVQAALSDKSKDSAGYVAHLTPLPALSIRGRDGKMDVHLLT